MKKTEGLRAAAVCGRIRVASRDWGGGGGSYRRNDEALMDKRKLNIFKGSLL